MTTRILLEYPDGTPVERIRNDLIDLARAEDASGQRPAMSIAGDDAEQVEYIQTRMAQARTDVGDYTPGGDLPATDAIVSNADTLPLHTNGGTASGNVTATVAANAVTNVKLPATSAVVTNGQVLNVTGGTVTLTVAANVVTAAYTAA